MSKIQRLSGELEKEYIDQMQLLHDSCKYYDEGKEYEAKRIALSLRILLHDTSRSDSLLGQLNKKNQFIDTSYAVPEPVVLATEMGKLSDKRRLFFQCVGPRPYAPLFLSGPEKSKFLNFDEWWSQNILADSIGNNFSRKSIVLCIANEDGGAHVAPHFKSKPYYDLTRNHSHGLASGISDRRGNLRSFQLNSPHLITIRQIGHEVINSLNRLYHYDGRKYYPGIHSAGMQIGYEPIT